MTRKGVVDRVTVHRGDERAGVLERTTRGATFRYDARYVNAHRLERGPLSGGIAVHLPLSTDPQEVAGTNLHPFFAGLLPEGARYAALLRAVERPPTIYCHSWPKRVKTASVTWHWFRRTKRPVECVRPSI